MFLPRLTFQTLLIIKLFAALLCRPPSSPHICRHPQRGRKLKEGDGISRKADGGWAAHRNYPKCYSNGTTSLYGQLRIPMLSNVLSQLRRCSYPLVIFMRAHTHTHTLPPLTHGGCLIARYLKTLDQYLQAAAELYSPSSGRGTFQRGSGTNGLFDSQTVFFSESISKKHVNHKVALI